MVIIIVVVMVIIVIIIIIIILTDSNICIYLSIHMQYIPIPANIYSQVLK